MFQVLLQHRVGTVKASNYLRWFLALMVDPVLSKNSKYVVAKMHISGQQAYTLWINGPSDTAGTPQMAFSAVPGA
jgi:hypothetical protein